MRKWESTPSRERERKRERNIKREIKVLVKQEKELGLIMILYAFQQDHVSVTMSVFLTYEENKVPV